MNNQSAVWFQPPPPPPPTSQRLGLEIELMQSLMQSLASDRRAVPV